MNLLETVLDQDIGKSGTLFNVHSTRLLFSPKLASEITRKT